MRRHENGLADIDGQLALINVAHTGDTTAEVVAQQLPRLLGDPARDRAALGPMPVRGHTLVVMTIGGNDVRQARWRQVRSITSVWALYLTGGRW